MLNNPNQKPALRVGDFVDVARGLRAEFRKTAAEVDRKGVYPAENMRLIHEAGLHAICLPVEWGGAIGKNQHAEAEALAEIFLELSAGESSTAQIFNVHRGLSFDLMSSENLSAERKSLIGREITEEGARFCSPASEPTKKRFSFQVRCTPVEGGVVLNGTKYFATGSEGATYGVSPVLMDGFPSVEEGGLHWALVPMNALGVTLNYDWDNMGQRATGSGSVVYKDVFIPDGCHWSGKGGRSDPIAKDSISGPAGQVIMSAIILGMGYGALDAMCDYVRTTVRPFNPEWKDATEDPIMQHHVGRFSTQLNAARAANREAARAVTAFSERGGSRADVSLAMMQAKVSIVDAALTTSGELHRLCGGMSTSNKFRFDRFWRNARTLSTHDSQDVKLRQIGSYVLSGIEPPSNYVT